MNRSYHEPRMIQLWASVKFVHFSCPIMTYINVLILHEMVKVCSKFHAQFNVYPIKFCSDYVQIDKKKTKLM